ncbi:MAG: AAA family ATPase [Candidatus Heimdallarchaeota archaeon]|nr:AAA family ATPase [Candidatus Heimdallarchaeota archaeon]
MRILWIQAKNFKCYSDIKVPSQGILPKGLLFVEGENSVGKSSLFDAIFYALFYDPTTTKELGTKDDLIRRGYSETEVEVAFELDNKCYLVQRNHSQKTAVQAYLQEIDAASALQGTISGKRKISEGVVEVDKKITALLNITKEKILNTLVVRQGSVQDLAEAKGAELRNIIYELFQLDFYRDRALEIIKEKKLKLDEGKKKYGIERTTEDIEKGIKETNESIKQSKKDINIYDSDVERLQIEISNFPDFKEVQEINGLTQRLDQQGRTIKLKQVSISELGKKFELKEPINQKNIESRSKEFEKIIEQNLDKKKTIEKEIEILNEERSKSEIERENFSERKKSLEKIAEKSDKPQCDVCEQEISESKFKELLNRSTQNIPALTQGIKKKEDAIKTKRSETKNLEQTNFQVQRDINKLASLINDIEELADLNDAKEEIENLIQSSLQNYKVKSLNELAQKFKLNNFSELFDHIKSLEEDIKKNELNKKHKLNTIGEKSELIEKLKKQIEENKKKEVELAKIDMEISIFDEVRTLVEKFIAEDLISNRMLAGIQQATRGYIFLFTKGRYSELYLEPTKAKTLNMSIKDEELGFVKSQNLLSGGDKAAIGLGLRIGISELLKRIRPTKDSPIEPPKMDILVLDEPLGSLDEERRSKVIEGLVAEKRFSQIFLITHTNIRNRFRAPMITVQSGAKGSTVSLHYSPSEVEEEAEE